MLSAAKFEKTFQYMTLFWQGVVCTVSLSALTVLFGFILALILAMARLSDLNAYRFLSTGSQRALQNRGGSGIICHKLSEKTGMLAGIDIVNPTDDIMIITESGMIIRTRSSDINIIGRNTSGVIVMRLKDDDRVMSFAKIKQSEEEPAESGENVPAEQPGQPENADAAGETGEKTEDIGE